MQERRAAGLGLSPGSTGLGGQVTLSPPPITSARQARCLDGPGTRCHLGTCRPLPSPPLPQAASWPAPPPSSLPPPPQPGAAGGLCPPCSESSVETAEPVLSVRTRSRLCTDSCSRRRFRKRCSRCSCSLMLSALRSCSSSFWRQGGCEPGDLLPHAGARHGGTEALAGSPSSTWPGSRAPRAPMAPAFWPQPSRWSH